MGFNIQSENFSSTGDYVKNGQPHWKNLCRLGWTFAWLNSIWCQLLSDRIKWQYCWNKKKNGMHKIKSMLDIVCIYAGMLGYGNCREKVRCSRSKKKHFIHFVKWRKITHHKIEETKTTTTSTTMNWSTYRKIINNNFANFHVYAECKDRP